MNDLVRVRISARGPNGEEDTSALAVLTDEGLLVSSPLLGDVGISWDDLLKVLRHPVSEQKLEEAEIYFGAFT